MARHQPRSDTRRLIANYDGGQHHQWAYASRQEMVDEFQAVADSDFRAVLWGVARSFATLYPSHVGTEISWSPQLPGFSQAGCEAVENYRKYHIDPLKLAVACAHEIGLEVFPQVRMSGEKYPPYHLNIGGPGGFQTNHPEFRCLTPEGDATRHLSQAFPEVRTRYVALFREWVQDYGADGVCIIFCRSWPYVLYEAPVIESFQAHHGMDMRTLDFFDERVLAHRASFVRQLLRETRQMLDEVGAKQGKQLQTSYVVAAKGYTPTGCPDLGPFTTAKSRAMDVETWVAEGLVDHLVVHIERVGDPGGHEGAEILKHYVDLAKHTKTQVYADLYPRRQSADSMRIRAMACYEAGVDGLSFWDCQGRAMRLSGWAMHRMLGHRDDLAEMKPFAEDLFRMVPMMQLGGFMVQNEFCVPTDG